MIHKLLMFEVLLSYIYIYHCLDLSIQNFVNEILYVSHT